MLYLIVDPKVFLLSEQEDLDKFTVDEFLAALVGWARAADEFDIEFGISQDCTAALILTRRSAFNREFIAELVSRVPGYNVETIITAITPLLDRLRAHSHLDDTLRRLNSDTMLYDLRAVTLAPPEHLDRLASESLQEAFRQMLGLLVFARQQQVIPLSEFGYVRLLTRYSAGEIQQWAADMAYKLLVHVFFNWELDETVPDRESLQNLTAYNDELETVYSPTSLPPLVEKWQFNSALSAAEAACRVYPNYLIMTPEAEATAQKSNFPNFLNLYRSLRALIEVWLPTYSQQGIRAANDAFYARVGYQISGESEEVSRNPKLRMAREGTYHGEKVYGDLHIKFGNGRFSARVHFAPVRDEDNRERIVLTRIGPHAPTARFK